MGYYHGQRKNPCPRCGGKVKTTFVSVTPMSFYQKCVECKTEDFTQEENEQLGENLSEGEENDLAVYYRR